MSNDHNQNIGELADETLGNLTVLEELLDDLDRDRDIREEQRRRARRHLETAQDNTGETLRRFEDTVGPI